MDKRIKLLRNDENTFRYCVPGIMGFFTMLTLAAVVKNDIFRDSYICLVGIADVSGLVFLTLLSGYLFSKPEEAVRSKRYLILLLLNIYIMTFFSALTSSIYGLPNHAGQITILCSLWYFFSMMLFLTLWIYQKQFLEDSALTRMVSALIILTLGLYTAALIMNMSKPILFLITEDGVDSGGVTDYISIFTDYFCILLLSIATFFSELSRNRKLAFVSCIFVPGLFVILSVNQDTLGRNITIWGIIVSSVLLPLCLIFLNSHDELEKDVLRHEKEQIKLQISAMMSQMQPHFLYNSLAVIAALCEENPKLAAEATNAFSDYLRENMEFADKNKPVSFTEELNHIKTYVWLEKLRFPNKLKVVYDISCTAFPVPALSVQPMVENAIKHGICKSKSGGTVRIASFETDFFYTVTVTDDGIGFDMQKKLEDGKRHLGLENSRYRIREMVEGSLDIESTPGKGTTVTITIPK